MWIAVDCLHPNMRCSGARRNLLGRASRSTLLCWIKTRELSRNLRMGLRPRTNTFMEKEARYSWEHLQDNRTRPSACDDACTRRNLGEMGGAGAAGMDGASAGGVAGNGWGQRQVCVLVQSREKAAEVEFAQTLERPADRRNVENRGKTVHEYGRSGAGSADLPDRLLRLVGGTTRRRGRHLVGLRACPWFSWRAGKCE
jgi:hypothetical protein